MQNLANFVFEKRTEIKNKIKEQIFANELRHHYNLRNPKGHKPTMVFLVVRINKEQVKISTGMKVYPIHWNVNRAKEGIGIFNIFYVFRQGHIFTLTEMTETCVR